MPDNGKYTPPREADGAEYIVGEVKIMFRDGGWKETQCFDDSTYHLKEEYPSNYLAPKGFCLTLPDKPDNIFGWVEAKALAKIREVRAKIRKDHSKVESDNWEALCLPLEGPQKWDRGLTMIGSRATAYVWFQAKAHQANDAFAGKDVDTEGGDTIASMDTTAGTEFGDEDAIVGKDENTDAYKDVI